MVMCKKKSRLYAEASTATPFLCNHVEAKKKAGGSREGKTKRYRRWKRKEVPQFESEYRTVVNVKISDVKGETEQLSAVTKVTMGSAV